jgi:hypothetical protein
MTDDSELANEASLRQTGDDNLQTQIAAINTNFASNVRGTILTGLSVATASLITTTDTVLAALGKLQGQLNSLESTAQLNARDTANRDRSNHTGVQAISTVTNLQTSLDSKYAASNPNGFETPTQLNARDTANRDRSNHTGTQFAATISNFATTVRATVLTGISFATATTITATDTVLSGLGKLQGQINTMLVTVTPQPTSTQNSAGTSTAVARADHTHDTVITRFRKVDNAPFQTSNPTYTVATNMAVTPTISGMYLLDFTCIATSTSNNTTLNAALFKNGTIVAETEAQITGRMNSVDILLGSSETYFNGTTDTIELRVSIVGGTFIAGNRRIRLTRVGP